MPEPDPTPDLAGFRPESVARFRYVDLELERDDRATTLTCRYALDEVGFTEVVRWFPSRRVDVDGAALERAAWLVFLLAGISYYKAAAPPVVVVEAGGLSPAERSLLEAFHLDGLGEYAFRNGLDLRGLRIEAPDRPPTPPPADARPTGGPLVPFGGGIDSIVTVEGIRDSAPDAALFVVSREGDRFDAIETAAAVTGLPVVRAERRLDPLILRSAELGFRNGHVPVTGVLSAIAVVAALLDGRDAVVMSNEWSASAGNVEADGRVVNHQWSKSLDFEDRFRATLSEVLPVPVDYFSWLRAFSELWVAERFARLDRYHRAFRSCNRAFHIDRAQRWDRWCGRCDKCCFIDLILAPDLDAAELVGIFDGAEPLADPSLAGTFRTLVGLSGEIKPFECVGDVDECRVALLLAADRPDRADDAVLQDLADELRPVVAGDPTELAARLRRPLSVHRVPDRYAPVDLLG